MVSVPAEIETKNLPNTSPGCCLSDILLVRDMIQSVRSQGKSTAVGICSLVDGYSGKKGAYNTQVNILLHYKRNINYIIL
jgi:hypothetical protein